MKTLLSLTAAALLLGPAFASADDAPAAPAGGAWAECNILAISAYRDHIGLICMPPSPDDGAPRQFAVEMTNPLSDAVLRLAQQSLTLKRPLRLLYVVAPEGNPNGCPAKTCRGIVGVEAR
jgi:hypothetical protein